MEIRFQTRNFTATGYLAQLSEQGLVTYWRGKHTAWESGYVFRFLWLGFVVRWGRIPYGRRADVRAAWRFNNLVQQANDGDYPD